MVTRPAITIAAFAAAAAMVAGCGDDAPLTPRREARADLSLSTARAKVGEPVDILLVVEHAEGTDARFPPVEALVGASGAEVGASGDTADGASGGSSGSASGGGLEVVRAGDVRTRELETGWLLTERKVTVRGFRTGAYSLGGLDVRLVPKPATGAADSAGAPEVADGPSASQPRSLKVPVARLEVYSMLAADSTLADLRGEAGPFEIEPEPARWGWALVVGFTVVAHIAMGAFALRRILRRREELRLHPPLPPPHETALAELARIRESGLLEEGRTAEYTDRVSDVLRRYLEERFAIPAPERTTEEFLDEVARAPVLDRERKRFLADYLAQCDLTKFAAARPGRRELDELFDSSVRFVEETAGARAAVGMGA
jgi:hypothetical protein